MPLLKIAKSSHFSDNLGQNKRRLFKFSPLPLNFNVVEAPALFLDLKTTNFDSGGKGGRFLLFVYEFMSKIVDMYQNVGRLKGSLLFLKVA